MTHFDFSSCVREACAIWPLLQTCRRAYPFLYVPYSNCAFKRCRSDICLPTICTLQAAHSVPIFWPGMWVAGGCLQSSLFPSRDPVCVSWRCSAFLFPKHNSRLNLCDQREGIQCFILIVCRRVVSPIVYSLDHLYCYAHMHHCQNLFPWMKEFIAILCQGWKNNRRAADKCNGPSCLVWRYHSVPSVAGESHHHKLSEWHVRVHAIHVIFVVNEHVEVVLSVL